MGFRCQVTADLFPANVHRGADQRANQPGTHLKVELYQPQGQSYVNYWQRHLASKHHHASKLCPSDLLQPITACIS